MVKLTVADVTLKEAAKSNEISLSFREKIEIAKLLSKINVSVIELPAIKKEKTDVLLIKTIASVVGDSVVAVPVSLDECDVERVYDAVKGAKNARIQIEVPVSIVQMEYICKRKPPKVIELISELTQKAKSLCSDVEFIAQDATRSEKEFLYKAVSTAISSGATSVTLCDAAGQMLPQNMKSFALEVFENVPECKNIPVSVSCSDIFSMATASSISAVEAGITGVKTSFVANEGTASTQALAKAVATMGLDLGIESGVSVTEISRTAKQIEWILNSKRSKGTPFELTLASEVDDTMTLNEHDGLEEVFKAVKILGYDLSSEDMTNVYEEFKRIASKKNVGSKELDAIVASVAMQVPRTYKLESYIINSGNLINATANITLEKDGEKLNGLCSGDGPINAAFLAIEQILGTHYELDDFQIQAVTEGQEAMGSALVKLRSNGCLYSGKGLSTDIIGAAIRAYLNAVNKIVYEEA